MKKAFTVTIENNSRIGKAVFSATDHKDVRRQFALMQSNDLNLKGFSIVKIQENEKPQRVARFERSTLRSPMGRHLDAASKAQPAGKKKGEAILKKENKNK